MIEHFPGKVIFFVFPSNKAGRHGAGAAKHAREHYGAMYGCGIGLRNRSYAIPTKDWDVYTPLQPSEVRDFVEGFLVVARDWVEKRPDVIFRVARIGAGLAAKARGVSPDQADQDFAPMFACAPMNCLLPREWMKILKDRPVTGFWPVW